MCVAPCWLQVSAQHAVKTLLTDHKFVRCSRDFVHFNLYPAIEQDVNIDASLIASASDAAAPLPTKPFSQQSLLECYRTRCTGPLGQNPNEAVVPGCDDGVTWKDLWLDRFLGRFKMHSGPLPKGDGLRWRMGNGLYIMQQQKQAIVVSTPFISANVRANERAAYAALLLFRPHTSREGLMTLGGVMYSSAVHLLDKLPPEELADDGWSQITRAEETAEESRELEEMCRRQDDAAHPLPEGGEDDDHTGAPAGAVDFDAVQRNEERGQGTAGETTADGQPVLGEDGARAAGIFFASQSDLSRARSFVHDQHSRRQQALDAEMRAFDDAIADATSHVGSGLPNQDVAEQRFNPKHVERLQQLHAKANAEQLTFLDCVHASVTGAHKEQLLLIVLSAWRWRHGEVDGHRGSGTLHPHDARQQVCGDSSPYQRQRGCDHPRHHS